MECKEYEYHNIPIYGGGYVTGLLYHENYKNILYARTDIGGTYRYDFDKECWDILISHVCMDDLSQTFPISIALNENRPNMLYIACGVDKPNHGELAISDDYGKTFSVKKMPMYIHGNLNGRGTDERLIVDKYDEQTLYFASQKDGLWVTHDEGSSWENIDSISEKYMTFVKQAGNALIVGTAGVTTGDEYSRGHSLYISYDKGKHFEEMDEPVALRVEDCKWNGLVAQRCAFDDKYLYITFASTGRNSYVIENGYSCDSGDSINGHIVRYPINADGTIGEHEDITPLKNRKTKEASMVEFGFSGISVSRQTPGLLVCTTIVKYDGDCVFRSFDYGNTWEIVLYDLEIGKMNFRASYMKPEFNGGHSLIHWLSDIKINPFNDNEAWFNTGTGVFRTRNLKDSEVCFCDWCDGIEETVHLNVYGLPKGGVRVLDIVGDLGGFAFDDIDKPCDNSFADANGNRYITCINADYSDINPQTFIATARGNWTGKTKGGLIITHDKGKTYDRISMPFGISEEIDSALQHIENPNVNAGWVAMSPDIQNIIWSIADCIELPISKVIVSNDGGKTFKKAHVFDIDGKEITQGHFKTFSDRNDSDVFYGFGEHSRIYVSKDKGNNFHEIIPVVSSLRVPDAVVEFPSVDFGLIDCADKTEIRAENGKTGVLYIAIGSGGLWKMLYEKEKNEITLLKLSNEGDIINRVGLGIGALEADYFKDPKAIYCNGTVNGKYGFYRSCDDCESFVRINDDDQMFGDIISIDGDCREFGVFYIATGSNGLKYGREKIK